MKIAVFGASGKTGKLIVQQGLDQGDKIFAFVRTPWKLPIVDPELNVVTGDVQNPEQVEEALLKMDAVISVLAPPSNYPVFAVSKGTRNILASMKNYGVKRLVLSVGAGVRDANDEPKFADRVLTALLKMVSRNVYEDMARTVDIVRASDADWTIVRVPMLTKAPATGNIRVGYVGKDTGVRLSRADLAAFMLKQVRDETYLHEAPAISN